MGKQPQGSQPAAWNGEDDDTCGKQPISSPVRGALSGARLTSSSRAVIDGMHRQAGDAQRGRTIKTVAAGGWKTGEEKAWCLIGVRLHRGAVGGAWTAEKALSATRASTGEREDHRGPQVHLLKKARIAFISKYFLPDSGFGFVLGLVFMLVIL